jgi:hypothetical protein
MDNYKWLIVNGKLLMVVNNCTFMIKNNLCAVFDLEKNMIEPNQRQQNNQAD